MIRVSDTSIQHGPSAALRTDTFTCMRCGLTVATLAPDHSRRNHCPSCLHSRHTVDHVDGGASDSGAPVGPRWIAGWATPSCTSARQRQPSSPPPASRAGCGAKAMSSPSATSTSSCNRARWCCGRSRSPSRAC
ncbi:RNHCP domain-containing protein, partial [Nocardia farcinica]|uniref:RNHCP domain-containing protein n=1 Tax=Nocardia farcinica TaxID=37329 RepID=UPI00313A962F